MKINKYIFPFSIAILSTVSAMAQETKVEERPVSEEIEIVRPYKPVLADAFKLRRSPDLENLQVYRARFNYLVNDRRLELNSDINKLEAEKMASIRPEVLLNNYVKLGGGTLSTMMAEGYVATGTDKAMQAGVFFRHFGQKGALDGQTANHQQITAFGKNTLDLFSVKGKLNFQRQGLGFYGFDPMSPIAAGTSIPKQAISIIEGEGEIASNFTEDEQALSYAAKINLYTLKDMYEAKESLFSLSANLNKRISDLNLGLAFNTEMGKTSDISTSTNANVLRMNPYIRFQTNGVKITAGANFVQEFGWVSGSKIFPTISADFTLVPDFLQLFGEVKGDVQRNTLRDFSNQLPFFGNNQILENSVEKLNITAGIKGTGGPGFGYKVQVYSKKIGNLPLFVNRFGDVSQFDIIYDRGNTNITGIEGSLSVQVSNDLTWTGKLIGEQFNPATEMHTWLRPSLRLNSDLIYTIGDKLSLSAAVYLQGKSKVKVYTAAPSSPYVLDYNIEQTHTIKAFVDVGAGLDYKVNKQFGAFIKVNNFLNQSYNRYLYYPSFGASIFGGLSYSF